MALGVFGSLIQSSKVQPSYEYSISKEGGIEMIFGLGKAHFSNPIIANNQPQDKVLENMREDGHVEVLS